jgi:hypothetical protein
MLLNTPTSAKNGTACTTGITTRALQLVPTGDKPHLTSYQKASHVSEMTQDGFTMVDQSKTYAIVVASKGAPHQKHQMVAKKPDNSITSQPATIRGVLTTAIDNQWVISTKVTLLEVEMERCKALITALEQNKLCKAMYRIFGVNYTETQGLPQPPTTAEVTEWIKEFTKNALTTKQPEKPLEIKSVIMHGHNHNYFPSNLNRSIFPKKPIIGR